VLSSIGLKVTGVRTLDDSVYWDTLLVEKTDPQIAFNHFDQDYPDPFMTKVYKVRPEKQPLLPAVTHVDGTGRLQTVYRAGAPLYWQLIKEFENLTGVPPRTFRDWCQHHDCRRQCP